MLANIPLLIFVIGAYNVLALITGTPMTGTMVSLTLPGGTPFVMTLGEVLILAGLVLLYLEIFKSTRTGVVSIIDHLLSIALFIVALVEFLLLPAMGTATFLILTVMTLVDVIAGFTVTISGARRDVGLTR